MLTRLSQITRDYREAGAMSALIPLYGFVDEGMFLTKGGDLGVVLRLGGVDYECLDAGECEAVTKRFEVALRLWDEHTRLYQYVLRRNCLPWSDPAPTDSPVDALLRKRRAFLEGKQDELYGVDLYLVILSEANLHTESCSPSIRRVWRAPAQTVREWLSPARTVVRLDTHLRQRCQQLRHKVDAFALQLDDTIRPRVLSNAQAFALFRRLLNYTPAKAEMVCLREDAFLDYDCCDSGLECHRTHLRLDDMYVRVITLKAPPSQTFPNLFRALYEIPSNLLLVNEWQREGQAAVRREIHAKRRHFHNARVSLASYAFENNVTNVANLAPAAPSELLVDDSAAALVRDLGACLAELTLQGRYFGQYTMTVVLYDQDPIALERSVAACTKAFAAYDAQVTEERYNLLNAWLAVLPGNSPYNVRSMHLLNTNYADLSLLFSHDAGVPRNAHLNREALAVLETTHGTPYYLNLHVEDVGHTLVLGATGSGKSFFLNFLIAHLQRYEPQTLIFDLGGSYEALTRYFGGRALRVAFDPPGFTINPFCLPPTAANLQFLFTFVRVLIQAGGQHAMTRADDQALYEQVETIYALDPDQRRLFTLATILPRPLAQLLQPWVQGGQYAGFFDHAEDTLTLAPFQCIDFEGLDGVPLVLEPLLFYLLHRATATVIDPARAARLKVFVLDEAWRFLRDATIRAYVTEALKTWRKKNACVLLATQSSEDLQRSELLRVAIESCPTKCFLANPHIDRSLYRELFHLNETEAAAIATLIPRQQFLFKQPDVAKVLNLHVDAESAALFGAGHRSPARGNRALASDRAKVWGGAPR
jgi:type IV secretion/conjugal transfer VirB4 family ATPase